MESSKSLKKGQIPVSCNLCKTDPKIKWKCVDCDALMCSRCKDIHAAIKTSQEHRFIDIKDVGNKAKQDFGNSNCQNHQGQICCLYCRSCHQPVCPLCIANIHNGHRLTEINNSDQFHHQDLKDILTRGEQKMKEIRKNENEKFMEIKRQIQNQNAVLKNSIDYHSQKLMTDLDQQWESLQNANKEEEKKIQLIKEEIKSHEATSKDFMILSNDNIEMLLKECKILEKCQKDEFKLTVTKFKSMPIFLPGEITTENMGSLKTTPTEVEMTITKQFTTDFSAVTDIVTNLDGSLWINDNWKKFSRIQHIKFEGNNVNVINSHKRSILDIALTPSRSLLLATGEPTVEMISDSTRGLTKSVYDVQPLLATAVHITDKEEILVGVRDDGPAFPATGMRGVIAMEEDGSHENIYENNQNGYPIFTYVRKITSTKAGTVAVIDALSDNSTGRVIILGQERGVLNIYNGHPAITSKKSPFKPIGMASTPSDNIIICEIASHTLHILNDEGHVLATYDTMDIGIQRPSALHYDNLGKLFIGCATAKSSGDKAKLYQVGVSGC